MRQEFSRNPFSIQVFSNNLFLFVQKNTKKRRSQSLLYSGLFQQKVNLKLHYWLPGRRNPFSVQVFSNKKLI